MNSIRFTWTDELVVDGELVRSTEQKGTMKVERLGSFLWWDRWLCEVEWDIDQCRGRLSIRGIVWGKKSKAWAKCHELRRVRDERRAAA